MRITEISTSAAPAPGGHYAQGTLAGNIVWTSGQVGIDPATGATDRDFGPQAWQAMQNLRSVLEASGAALTDVVKTTCFLTNVADFAEFNARYTEFFGDHRPARSTFVVGLAGGFIFEIEAMAVLGSADKLAN